VKNELVIRLQKALEPSFLEALNSEFPDVMTEGHFEQRSALAVERDETDLAHLPRLIFKFNRRNFGRLRALIDALNRGSVE
jgi:hypothetical protein